MVILTLITIGTIFFTIILMESPEYNKETELTKYNYWTYLCVLIYAIIVTTVNAFVSSIAEYIVEKQNIGNDAEYEQTLTKYIFIISFLYAYSGLFVLAFHL